MQVFFTQRGLECHLSPLKQADLVYGKYVHLYPSSKNTQKLPLVPIHMNAERNRPFMHDRFSWVLIGYYWVLMDIEFDGTGVNEAC